MQLAIDFSTGEVTNGIPFQVKEIPLQVQKIHERAVATAKVLVGAQGELVSIFEEMDQHRGYLYYEVGSLTAYGIEVLGLCEGTSRNLVTIARKADQFPQLKAAVQSGEVDISIARKISSVMTAETEQEWIDLAKSNSARKVEKEIARANPAFLIPEKLKYKSAERLELTMGVSEELANKFNRVKDLLAQKNSKLISSEEALEALVNEFIERHDPIKKAERAEKRSEKKMLQAVSSEERCSEKNFTSHSDVERVTGRVSGRVALPAETTHKVNLKDQHQCTYVYPNGRRCGNRKWLEIHHIIPVSEGGSNELSNLTIYCSAHHRLVHQH